MRSTRPAGHAMYREIFGDEDDELSDCMEVEDFSDDKSLPVGKSVKLVGVVLSKSATKQDVPPKPVSKKGRPPLNGKSTSGQKKPLGRPRTRKSTDGKNASAKSSAGNARKLSNGKKMRRVTLPQVGDSNGKEACLPELAVIHMSEASDGKEKEDFIHGPTESAVSHVQEPSDDQEKEGLILGLLPMVETTVDNTVLSDMASTRVETPPMHQKIDKRRSEPTRKFSFNKVIRSSFRLTPSRKPKRLSAPNTSIPSPPAQKREAIPTSARRSDRLLFAHIVEQVSPSQSEEVSASHANVLSKSTKTKRKTVENGLLEESALSPYLASPVQDETDQLVPVEETPQWQSRPLPSSSSENDAGTSKKIVNLEDAAGDITVIDAPSPRRRTIRKKSADEYVTPLVSSRSGDESINLERSVEIVNATMGTTVIDTATARRRLKRKKVPQDDEHVTPQLSSRLRDVSITAENDKAVLDAAMSTTILDTPSPRRRSIRTKIAQDELVAPQPSSRLRDDSMAVEKGMDLLNAAKGTTVLDTPSPRRRSIRTKIAQDELVAPQASFRLRDDSMTAEKDMDVLDAAMSTTILDTPSPRRRSIRTKIAQDDLVAPQPSSRLRDDSITAERGMELLDAAKGTTVLDTPSSRRRSIRTKVAQDELVAPPFSPHLEDDSQISNAAMEILMFDTPSTRRQAAKVARQKQETIAAEWKSQTPEHAMTPDLIPNSLDHPEGKQTSAKRPKRKRGLPSKFRDDSTSMNSSTPTSRDRSPPFASPIDTTKTLVYKITIPKPPGASAPSNPSTSLLVQADGSNTSTDLNSALNSVQQLDAITPTAVPQPLDILGPATPAKGTPDISGDPTTATSSILDDSSGLPAQTDDGGTPPPGQQQPSVMNESAADNTSTLEIQNSSCMRPLYASFGKCKNCLGKVAGRACQFNGFRAFRRLNHTLGGKAEFTSHDPPHWLCPQFSRRKLLEPALAYKLRLAYSAFRDLVEIELSHIVGSSVTRF
ncbi:hypothetical protein DFS34DRAFT_35531 [Phlyctochytrium arcticum]|nr:hypothetical protein DFS34DRAFT_35531 [Phlyctochytrium arcticum]